MTDAPQAQGAAPLKGQPNETPMTDEVAGLYAEVERLKRCVGIERRCKESVLRTIDKLQAQLAQPRGWICKQCFVWVLTREAHKPCQSCRAPWELQHPIAAKAAADD